MLKLLLKGNVFMLTGKQWTSEDIEKYRVEVIIASRGKIISVTPKKELVVQTYFGTHKLDLSESVFWYASMYDALEYEKLYKRYYDAEKRLGVKLDKCQDVVNRMVEKHCLCMGVEENREDALFTTFSIGMLCKVLDKHSKKESKGGLVIPNIDVNFPFVEQTPKKTLPISNEEQMFLDMLDAEDWCIAEITRNFVHKYDTDITRDKLPHEKVKILSLNPVANVVRMNYEKNPMARTVALIALELLRKRKIMLF